VLIRPHWGPGVCCRVENPIEIKDFGLFLHCVPGEENIVVVGDNIGVEGMELLKEAAKLGWAIPSMDDKDWT
jgi:hypothetical protein